MLWKMIECFLDDEKLKKLWWQNNIPNEIVKWLPNKILHFDKKNATSKVRQ